MFPRLSSCLSLQRFDVRAHRHLPVASAPQGRPGVKAAHEATPANAKPQPQVGSQISGPFGGASEGEGEGVCGATRFTPRGASFRPLSTPSTYQVHDGGVDQNQGDLEIGTDSAGF